jgi:gas vesicle protein
MSVFLGIAIFGLGVLVGHATAALLAAPANGVEIDDFCEHIAEKVACRIKGE